MLVLLLFLLGICFGSFINMLVFRLHSDESLWGRSYCDKTKNTLSWKDLIPIGSFIFYKAKCRECGTKLTIVYPFVELICGLLPILLYLNLLSNNITGNVLFFNLILQTIFTYFLVFFAVYDYFFWEVDVRVTIIAIILTIIIGILNQFNLGLLLPSIGSSIASGLFASLVISLIILFSKGSGMGDGDIFLFAFIGLLSGIEIFIITFFVIIWMASIMGIIKAIFLKKFKGVLIQFAPFISMGGILVLFFRNDIISIIAKFFII